MPTVCKKGNQVQFEFQHASTRQVVADFQGGDITSDAGALLVRQVANHTHILSDVASCFIDHRRADLIEHRIEELVGQRILGIACGYEDPGNHDQLRDDPLWRLLAGKANPGQEPAAGKSTLNRLEAGIARGAGSAPGRYHKIGVDEQAFTELFTRWYIAAHQDDPPEEIILDLDATDDPLHGDQEGKFFHGYYYHYCYLPLYMFAGDHLLWAELRPSDIDGSKGSEQALEQVVGQLREVWPSVRIIVRGDSGFARDGLMGWCEAHGVEYVFGLAKNNRLRDKIAPQTAVAERLHHLSGEPERVFAEFWYQTRDSWSRSRRVIGKAEYVSRGANPRFVVTSLHPAQMDGQRLYEQLYCARGEAENRIKEQQLYLFADRTSCSAMKANQLRLWFSSVAYCLLNELRRVGLKNTEWARAQCHSIREKLLKIGGLVRVSVRRIHVGFASGYPWKDIFRQVAGNIRRGWEPSYR
jgi:hypothetical protein